MDALRRLIAALVWAAIAALVALGGAGIATELNHPPGGDARPELTWVGDQASGPTLDAATSKLQVLSGAVDALGTSSRRALASFIAGDTSGLTTALGAGTGQLAAVSSATDGLQSALAAVPYTGADAPLRVSPGTRDRFEQLAATPHLTKNLEADWGVLSARAMAASAVPDLLALHDQQTAAAAKEGEAGHYQQALALLDAPDATIVEARRLRDGLAENADVSTLTQWIDRQAAYDTALRQLYKAMLGSNGRVTSTVRTAFAAEEAAKGALPTDTKGIVAIMGDIARGGLNQVVIDIEQARGSLAEALSVQQASAGGPAG
ncbi:MAG TPA: hypothetical protein VIH37_01265, partial [Candidatus Limnocylindrales bacterium]